MDLDTNVLPSSNRDMALNVILQTLKGQVHRSKQMVPLDSLTLVVWILKKNDEWPWPKLAWVKILWSFAQHLLGYKAQIVYVL